MEVHHHSHHPKKWKEFITEFLMLFLAVTLGFFAENQREHLIEGNREKQYMQSLYEDLRKDTTILNNLVRYDTIQNGKLDTTNQLLIENKWDVARLKLLYRLNLKTAGAMRYNLSERTSAQLKNAGGMRLVANQELSNKISEYWVKSGNLKESNTFVDDLKFKAREKSYSIFDQKYYTNVSKGIVADNVQLMTKDDFILAEYANRLSHINNSMKNVLLPSIDKHYKRAVELLSILKKEYKLKEDADIDVSNF
jgi:polyhydroxyalkanoate synthesis regulator phasin